MSLTLATIMSVALNAHAPPITDRDAVMVGFVPGETAEVIVRVVGSGCTKPDDLTVNVDGNGLISVERLRPDRCRKRLEWVEFRYSLDELGATGPVFVPLQSR